MKETKPLAASFQKGKDRGKGNQTKLCVIYTRVSTKEQAETNLSLDTQRKACEKFAERNGYGITGYFGGTFESAKNDERKEFQRMLSFVKRSKEKISHILVYSIDRFSRSGANAIYISKQLKENGVFIQSVLQPTDASTSAGTLNQNIFFIFSEYDNQQRREKICAGLKEQLLRGNWPHKPPLGYDSVYTNGKRSLIINKTGKLLRQAFLLKIEERKSNREILETLASKGLTLYDQAFTKILFNPFYCGLLSHQQLEGEIVKGNHEPLISQEQFEALHAIKNRKISGYETTDENESVPLKLFLKCETCGSNMRGYIVQKKKIWYYKCNNSGCHNNKSAKSLHQTFNEILNSLTLPEELKAPFAYQLCAAFNQEKAEKTETKTSLKEQVKALDKKLADLKTKLVEDKIPRDVYDEFAAKYKAEKAEIEEKLTGQDSEGSNLENWLDKIVERASNFNEIWASGTYRQKQAIQKWVFPKGFYYDKKNDQCRTPEINQILALCASAAMDFRPKEKGNSLLVFGSSPYVEVAGIEPASGEDVTRVSTCLDGLYSRMMTPGHQEISSRKPSVYRKCLEESQSGAVCCCRLIGWPAAKPTERRLRGPNF